MYDPLFNKALTWHDKCANKHEQAQCSYSRFHSGVDVDTNPIENKPMDLYHLFIPL